jgi:hypothetical protein
MQTDELYGDGDTGNSPDMSGDEEEGGYCIKIYVDANNQAKSVCIEMENGEEEGIEEEGQMGAAGEAEGEDEESEETKIPVNSFEQAMHLAMQAYKNNGQLPMQGDQGMDQGSAMDDMMQGYGSGSLRSQQRGMGIGKVFK